VSKSTRIPGSIKVTCLSLPLPSPSDNASFLLSAIRGNRDRPRRCRNQSGSTLSTSCCMMGWFGILIRGDCYWSCTVGHLRYETERRRRERFLQQKKRCFFLFFVMHDELTTVSGRAESWSSVRLSRVTSCYRNAPFNS
jgi:hypothetical protein